jgi:hypothetical protein
MSSGSKYQSCDSYLTVQKYKYYSRFSKHSVFSVRFLTALTGTNAGTATPNFTRDASIKETDIDEQPSSRYARIPVFL